MGLQGKEFDTDWLLFKMRDDPRITRVGKFLRRFSLEELPMLKTPLAVFSGRGAY